ncbi:MAG TPA: GNAT family N-acetyltransferase [Sphingomicrobium sp.]|nr:GNAT family N-acetyltransferase [Sphingomicrobium sp.]
MSKRADIAIRLARADEREALEALQWRASLANDDDRPHLEANPDAIDLPASQIEAGQVWVAEIGGTVGGFAAVIDGELDGLFVEPPFWRSGVGSALVEKATNEARNKGLALGVIASPNALGFYQRCGFSIEGEAQTRFGPAIRMSK